MSLALLALNEALGKPLDDGTMQNFLFGSGTFLVARGVADHGAGGSVRKAGEVFNLGVQILKLLKENHTGITVTRSSGGALILDPIKENIDEDHEG
jgi:hypothetical protein